MQGPYFVGSIYTPNRCFSFPFKNQKIPIAAKVIAMSGVVRRCVVIISHVTRVRVEFIYTPNRCFSLLFRVYIIQLFAESLYCVHSEKVLHLKKINHKIAIFPKRLTWSFLKIQTNTSVSGH